MEVYYETHRDDMDRAHAWYASDDQCPPHFHSSIEVVYVLEGTLSATLDGAEHIIHEKSLLINSSYTVHSYATPVSSRTIIAIVPLRQLPSLRKALAHQSFSRAICPDDVQGTLGTLMRMMVENQENLLALKGICYTLMGLLIERVGLTETRDGSRTAFIREVLEFLEQHHTEPLRAEDIAQHFGYSRSRFSHIFNAHLGYTISDYVSTLRCHHAAQLLRETDLPVSDVAMQVGFESLRTFYRTFKKQYEMTPNQYAKA